MDRGYTESCQHRLNWNHARRRNKGDIKVKMIIWMKQNEFFLSYLRPLFLSQFHLTLDEFLPSTCLLLESFLQFLPSFPLLLQCLLPHVHLTLLRNNFNCYSAIGHTSTHTHTPMEMKRLSLCLYVQMTFPKNYEITDHDFNFWPCVQGGFSSLPELLSADAPSPRASPHLKCWRCSTQTYNICQKKTKKQRSNIKKQTDDENVFLCSTQ